VILFQVNPVDPNCIVLVDTVVPPPRMISDVPALNVQFVVVVHSHIFGPVETVTTVAPSVIVRVPVPVLLQPFVPSVSDVVAEKSSVPVNNPVVSDDTLTVARLTVTVPLPEFASNVTVSLAVGTADGAPVPVAVPQCVWSLASHVPVPPTQNFATMAYTSM